MANCKSITPRAETYAESTLDNRKRWTSLSSKLAKLAIKVNPGKSDETKQGLLEVSLVTSRECLNVAWPHSELSGGMKDEGLDNFRARSLLSKGDLTAMTASSSSDESSTATESPETSTFGSKRYINRAIGRPAFRRSLTDEDYNLFLDFLEAPNLVSASQQHRDQGSLHSTEGKPTDQDNHSSDSNGLSRSSGEDLGFVLFLPNMQVTPRESRDNCDDVSILPTDGFDELELDPANEEYVNIKVSPHSRGKESITSTAIAWSALAALLGTHSPSSPFQEKKSHVIKNLWSDDVVTEDDIISLAASEGFIVDDNASMPSLDV